MGLTGDAAQWAVRKQKEHRENCYDAFRCDSRLIFTAVSVAEANFTSSDKIHPEKSTFGILKYFLVFLAEKLALSKYSREKLRRCFFGLLLNFGARIRQNLVVTLTSR
jgi:hypothetical protein